MSSIWCQSLWDRMTHIKSMVSKSLGSGVNSVVSHVNPVVSRVNSVECRVKSRMTHIKSVMSKSLVSRVNSVECRVKSLRSAVKISPKALVSCVSYRVVKTHRMP